VLVQIDLLGLLTQFGGGSINIGNDTSTSNIIKTLANSFGFNTSQSSKNIFIKKLL
jgi:hypothetical protein